MTVKQNNLILFYVDYENSPRSSPETDFTISTLASFKIPCPLNLIGESLSLDKSSFLSGDDICTEKVQFREIAFGSLLISMLTINKDNIPLYFG